MRVILSKEACLRFARAAAVACVAIAGLTPSPFVHAETITRVLPDGTLYVSNIQPANVPPAGASATVTPEPPPAPAERPLATVEAMASDLRALITRVAERYALPTSLIEAVIAVESGFQVRAVSPKGAQGLMQLMPQTAAMLGVKDAFDPIANIEGGVRHLRGLVDQFSNNLPLALAAYNAGAGAVARHGGIPPYRETQEYVARILKRLGGAPRDVVARDEPPAAERFSAVRREIEESGYAKIARADGTVVYTNRPAERTPRFNAVDR